MGGRGVGSRDVARAVLVQGCRMRGAGLGDDQAPVLGLGGRRVLVLCSTPEVSTPSTTMLSDTMYASISFRKPTPPRNRQPNDSISNSKQ